ncbi:WD repeat-containing and planar cell polarity effector protein fritz homolog [Uloborus diversus]|uniref:WD repeat-containing and planar cell polarity effector protein fritz homolog n=1 Tax=Uloborus diversus TaxID=327109 RepID=UPI00240A3ABA|nr:WD repeat-containing and planar cell polarity effector protein fritz homolog [Uloborus diversus]
MASLLSSLCLLNLKPSEVHHSEEVDCMKIARKDLCTQGMYSFAKREQFFSRCEKTKLSLRHKKNIKTIYSVLRLYRCISLSWETDLPLTLFFNNGSIIGFEFNEENNTLLTVESDDYLCGKLLQSHVIDVIINHKNIFVSYSEPKLTVVYIKKHVHALPKMLFAKKGRKFVGTEPKILHFDLVGPSNKSLARKLSLNIHKDCLLIWWKISGDGVWPWTPVTYCTDHINMVIYKLNGFSIELLNTIKIQGELIHAHFSSQHFNQIYTLEKVIIENTINISVCNYEVIGDQCHLLFLSKLSIEGQLVSFDFNSSENKLILLDSEKNIVLHDLLKKTTLVTSITFLPKHVAFHPENYIALVIGVEGQVQCFDIALNCLNFKMFYSSTVHNVLHLISHVKCFKPGTFSVQKALWQKSSLSNTCMLMLNAHECLFIFLKLTSGCIPVSHFTALELTCEYLKHDCIDEAILVLRSLNWSHQSSIIFQCLSKIVNFLLRKPFSFLTKAGIQMALATFYNSVDFIPENILSIYVTKIYHIARRFFHRLLQFQQFREAFLLAVDLESEDLFLDLYHVAKRTEENVLASVALSKAQELGNLHSSCSYSSETSSTSYCESETSDAASTFEEIIKGPIDDENSLHRYTQQHRASSVEHQTELQEQFSTIKSNFGQLIDDRASIAVKPVSEFSDELPLNYLFHHKMRFSNFEHNSNAFPVPHPVPFTPSLSIDAKYPYNCSSESNFTSTSKYDRLPNQPDMHQDFMVTNSCSSSLPGFSSSRFNSGEVLKNFKLQSSSSTNISTTFDPSPSSLVVINSSFGKRPLPPLPVSVAKEDTRPVFNETLVRNADSHHQNSLSVTYIVDLFFDVNT